MNAFGAENWCVCTFLHILFSQCPIVSLNGKFLLESPKQSYSVNRISNCFGDFGRGISFPIHLFREPLEQPDDWSDVASDSQFSSKVFGEHSKYSGKDLGKKQKRILSTEYCIALHDNKVCFLPNWWYRIMIKGETEKILPKTDALCCTYQLFDYLCTQF